VKENSCRAGRNRLPEHHLFLSIFYDLPLFHRRPHRCHQLTLRSSPLLLFCLSTFRDGLDQVSKLTMSSTLSLPRPVHFGPCLLSTLPFAPREEPQTSVFRHVAFPQIPLYLFVGRTIPSVRRGLRPLRCCLLFASVLTNRRHLWGSPALPLFFLGHDQ